MKLDSRIIEGKRPLSCFDTEQAKEFLGKECYFSDRLCTFNQLLYAYSYVTADILVSKEKYLYVGELLTVGDSDGSCYEAGINGEAEWFQFCLPCEWVKEPEKKYRPYTLAEWVDQHEIGEIIHCRNEHKQEFHVMYTGYVIDNGEEDIQDNRTTGRIMLINMGYLLQELFERYEICINGEWMPFGIEVEK